MIDYDEMKRHQGCRHAWRKIVDGIEDLRQAQGYLDGGESHMLEVARWELQKVEQVLKKLSEEEG